MELHKSTAAKLRRKEREAAMLAERMQVRSVESSSVCRLCVRRTGCGWRQACKERQESVARELQMLEQHRQEAVQQFESLKGLLPS